MTRRPRSALLACMLLLGLLCSATLVSAAPAAALPGSAALPASSAAVAADEGGNAGEILVTVPESEGAVEITNAQFRWGLNPEAGAGAFFGGCNFLSAGKAGNSGGTIVWTEAMGLYRASEGKVRIEKPDSSGSYRLASFANRCTDALGNVVAVSSLTSSTHNQAVIDGGTGRWLPGKGIEIQWKGSFTVAFYGGMTYWSVTDPVLTVDASGTGRVTATASGYAASMEDLTKWGPIEPRSIVLAELRSVPMGAQQGFTSEPLYLGVAVADAGQVGRTSENSTYWGSFPSSFVQFQKLTGQAGYWLTTGGQRDRAKVPTTLYISYDASAPLAVAPPSTGSGDSANPQNSIRTRSAADAAQTSTRSYPLADATTLTPQGAGLLSEMLAATGFDRFTMPLLWLLLTLSATGISVLYLRSLLPWQRPRTSG